MDYAQLLNMFLALVFVLALMGVVALIAKRMGLSQTGNTGKNKRLQVVETLPLDHKRKAIILRRDQKEHLVILGPNGETVVEKEIPIRETHGATEYLNPFE